MPPKTIYNTIEELRDAKRKNALNTYYRKRLRDSEYLQKKKIVKAAMKDRNKVKLLYKYLLIEHPEVLEQSATVVSRS